MRLTESKLRRVIRSVIAESQHDAMSLSKVEEAKAHLEELVEYGLGISGPVKFSEVCRQCGSPGSVSADDVMAAIISNPRDYRFVVQDGKPCVSFENANVSSQLEPEDLKRGRDLNSSIAPLDIYSRR